MAESVAPWTLTIASDLRMLATARAFIEAVCQAAGFDEATTHAIVLATDEAVNNIIRHAHQDRPDAVVQMQCFLRSDAIEIRLIDEGDPFDITAVPHMDPGELRVGGRGVFLMRSLMDELSSQPRGEGGNTLRMVKRCGRARRRRPPPPDGPTRTPRLSLVPRPTRPRAPPPTRRLFLAPVAPDGTGIPRRIRARGRPAPMPCQTPNGFLSFLPRFPTILRIADGE